MQEVERRYLRDAALAGLGIGMLPVHYCADDLVTKRLSRVLPQWCSPEVPVYAVYPSAPHLSPKVKAFADHLRERMTASLT